MQTIRYFSWQVSVGLGLTLALSTMVALLSAFLTVPFHLHFRRIFDDTLDILEQTAGSPGHLHAKHTQRLSRPVKASIRWNCVVCVSVDHNNTTQSVQIWSQEEGNMKDFDKWKAAAQNTKQSHTFCASLSQTVLAQKESRCLQQSCLLYSGVLSPGWHVYTYVGVKVCSGNGISFRVFRR